ncbi:MAG: glycosyltransferase [Alphaproteobacteria bacterium]|nr:MAG: glycosyltransferase [Alphaproteobacteria bacterium]
MIAVLIPAHNEEQLIAQCLHSINYAATHPGLRGEEVVIVVALDRCRDGTRRIVERFGCHWIELVEGNVGLARAAAATRALQLGARWLATTDADSVVPFDWLASQLAADADAFCGIVAVEDWEDYPPEMAIAFAGTEAVSDGHPHVHGANMGVSADFYQRCGGFQALTVSEDVALIQALMCSNARIARLAQPIVRTSARRTARASGGFSDYLKAMEERLAVCPTQLA